MIRAFKLTAMALWIGLCFVPAWLACRFKKPRLRDRIVRGCYKILLWIFNIRLSIEGAPASARPLLLVSNHISYLDVLLLGAAGPFRFTPKSEVESWPAISSVCRVTGCVFIDRNPANLKEPLRSVRGALEAGEAVSLFPEGTTGAGIHVLPFKSSLFQVAETPIEGGELVVQPVAISYTHIRGLPIDSSQWPDIAWYGDMALMPHLWNVLGLGRIDARLAFLEPSVLSAHGDRKKLAAHCREEIIKSFQKQ